MDRDQLAEIVDRYLQGNATRAEEQMLEDLFQHRQKTNLVLRNITEKQKATIKKELLRKINRRVELPMQKSIRQLWPVTWKIAASILLIACISYFLLPQPEEIPVAEIRFLSKSTLPGQKSKLELSDGSIVYLNSASKISYPATFAETREVHLQGEAFFQVAENPEQPFIVRTGTVQTQVLGTQFNVNNYQENTSVTVISGKVKVSGGSKNQEVLLTRNQQVNFVEGNSSFLVQQVVAEQFIAWTTGRLVIENLPLARVEKILERWYNVDIVFNDKALLNCLFTTDMQQEPLEVLLKDLQLTLNIQYQITRNRVYLSGPGCN